MRWGIYNFRLWKWVWLRKSMGSVRRWPLTQCPSPLRGDSTRPSNIYGDTELQLAVCDLPHLLGHYPQITGSEVLSFKHSYSFSRLHLLQVCGLRLNSILNVIFTVTSIWSNISLLPSHYKKSDDLSVKTLIHRSSTLISWFSNMLFHFCWHVLISESGHKGAVFHNAFLSINWLTWFLWLWCAGCSFFYLFVYNK